MSAAENLDNYMNDIRLMQRYQQTETQLKECKTSLTQARLQLAEFEKIKNERDVLRQLKTSVEDIACNLVTLAAYSLENDVGPPSSLPNLPCSLVFLKLRILMEKTVNKKVEARLQRELDQVFRSEAEQVAREVIANSFGQGPYDVHTKAKIQKIRDRCRANAYAALSGPWAVNCPNCSSKHSYLLDDKMVQDLVAGSVIRQRCQNKGSISMFVRYLNDPCLHGYVQFTLRQVIRMFLLAA